MTKIETGGVGDAASLVDFTTLVIATTADTGQILDPATKTRTTDEAGSEGIVRATTRIAVTILAETNGKTRIREGEDQDGKATIPPTRIKKRNIKENKKQNKNKITANFSCFKKYNLK